jgi:pimeloyl-ACP methyl ester carboxylesterase
MEFEHVTFDLPHGTFHALQGGDPDGQPTLVLHGFPDHPPTAKPFLAELGRRGRHVVAPWLRGYAPSPTAGPFDFASLTSDVLALIDQWSPGRAVELIGHDWGALITYDACVTAPERIERAVTLAIPHPLTFPDHRDGRRDGADLRPVTSDATFNAVGQNRQVNAARR